MDTGENEPATKADLKAVECRLDGKIDGLEKSLGARIDGLDGKIASLDKKVDGIRHDLTVELVKTNARMERMEERLTALIREESDKTVGRIDAFLNRLETYGRETATIPGALDEHGKKIRDHETRISALESPRSG